MKQLLSIVLLSVAAVSCSENEQVMDRFNECLELVQNEATQVQSLECWSEDSRAVVQGVLEQEENSASTLEYLERYQQLLNHKEVDSLEVYGDLALMRVTKGRSSQEFVLVKEAGDWRINALELRSFWRPLDDVARAQ